MAKGITGTGEGFDLPGRRLGGFSRQPPVSSLRQTALAAAEKRARLGSLVPSGPKRLGGDSSIMDALSPIQAAAMAAERRLQDDIWCGSQSCEASEGGESSSDLSDRHVHREQSAGMSSHGSGRGALDLDVTSRKRSHETGNWPFSWSFSSHPDTCIMDMLQLQNPILNHDTRFKKVVNQINILFSHLLIVIQDQVLWIYPSVLQPLGLCLATMQLTILRNRLCGSVEFALCWIQ